MDERDQVEVECRCGYRVGIVKSPPGLIFSSESGASRADEPSHPRWKAYTIKDGHRLEFGRNEDGLRLSISGCAVL